MTTSSQSGCILVRKAGVTPPTELLQKILDANPKGWGATVVSEVDGHKFLELNSGTTGCSLELLTETFETFADQDITFYFCNSTAALSEKDMSPYILIAKPVEEDPDEEEPQLVAFIRGNFPSFVKAGSSHPAEYHMVVDTLIPKFEGLYEMVDGDLDKLMLNLMKPHFKKELLLNSVSEGTITLVAANGVTITFQQEDEKTSMEGPDKGWWVSNSYGYGVEKAAEPPKKKGLFAGKSTVRERATQVGATTIVDKAAIEPAKTDTTAEVPFPDGWSIKKWSPQANSSRKDRENAYKMRIGYLPEGHRNNVEISVAALNDKLQSWGQVKALGLEGVGIIAALSKANPVKAGEGTLPVQVQSSATLPATSKPVSAEILPIMGPKTREHINDIRRKDGYKKIIDENAKTITDPKQFESYETRFADFTAQMGIDQKGPERLMEFACWSYEMMYELCKSDPNGASVMMKAFIDEYLKANLKIESAKEEVAPQKKGLFAKKSAAA